MKPRALSSGAHIFLFVCGVLLAYATGALAEDSKPPSPQPTQSSPARPLPDYDGRSDSTSVGETLLWIPRIVLSPLYLVSEYVVRRPLEFVVTEAERAQLPEAIYNLFLFGPNHSAGVLPIAFVDFGFLPSLGLYFFWNDFIPHHDLQVRGSTFGIRWLSGAISDRIHIDPVTDLVLSANAIRRPDLQFYGVGSDTLQSAKSRYGASRLEANVALELKLGKYSRLTSHLGMRSVHFHRGGFGGNPLLEDQVAQGIYPEPDWYDSGYTMLTNMVQLVLDTRQARPASGSGVRLEARVEQLSELKPAIGSGILRYGGSAGGFWDVGPSGRVLSLSLATNFVDPLRKGSSIPFTELAEIGGGELMRGFLLGRLYGRSLAVATLRYRWPVWVWLDGSIQVALGNVFDEHFANIAPKKLRFSGSIGVESVGSPDSSLELLLGIGSETFEHGGQITSLRFVVGTNHGF
jgi:hypothetical protein